MSDDEDNRKDLTRLEDLPAFDHEDDTGVNRILESFNAGSTTTPDLPSTPNDDFDEENDFTDSDALSEESTEEPIEDDFEEPSVDFSDDDDSTDSIESNERTSTESLSVDSLDDEDEFPSFEDDDEELQADFGDDDDDDDENADEAVEEGTLSEENVEEAGFTEPEEPIAADFSDSEDDSEEENDEFNSDFADEFPADPHDSDSNDEESIGSENETISAASNLDENDEDEETLQVVEEISEDLDPEPIDKTPLPSTETMISEVERNRDSEKNQPSTPVSFEDIRDFGENISYGTVGFGGNPPFSIMLTGIKYIEDTEDVQRILNEHGLITDDNEEGIVQSLSLGNLLISQISEYSAIYLAHKFRRFDCNITLGLSDELHPSKSYDHDQKGLISKANIYQNKSESFNLAKAPVNVHDIILATTPSLESFQIDKYIDIITEHTIIDEDDLARFHYQQEVQISNNEDSHGDHNQGGEFDPLGELQKFKEEMGDGELDDDDLLAEYGLGLNEIYRQLAEKIKQKAFLMKGNAVVGINYQLTPIGNLISNDQDGAETNKARYKITCTGNVVLLTDQVN